MTGLIDRLEKKGFVQRLPGKDRRSKLLRITPKGAKLLDEVWPRHLEMVQRLVGSVGKREAHQLVLGLAQLRMSVA
jgi:DNA-binding MarR family transcriptional regulator